MPLGGRAQLKLKNILGMRTVVEVTPIVAREDGAVRTARVQYISSSTDIAESGAEFVSPSVVKMGKIQRGL